VSPFFSSSNLGCGSKALLMGAASLVLLVRAAPTYRVDVRCDGAREDDGQKRRVGWGRWR
jgi:hypothetical protein